MDCSVNLPRNNTPPYVLLPLSLMLLFSSWGLALKAAGRDDSSMNLLQGDMFIVRYRPIRSLVLDGRVDLI